MSRRDTILVAVLINTGLLALLFMIAVNPVDDDLISPAAPQHTSVSSPSIPQTVQEPVTMAMTQSALEDEVDKALQDFAEVSNTVMEKKEIVPKPTPVVAKGGEEEEYLEITVKRGDVLERIARANKTTVSKLKKINKLSSEQIVIGQVLRVPRMAKQDEPIVAKETQNPMEFQGDNQFYTIKSGDNPWKIAKQFHVRFDELLDLNNLDESKARNLKVGDRIRVH